MNDIERGKEFILTYPLFYLGGDMRIIGLDQSTTGTGVSFFIDDVLHDYILLKPKSSKKLDEVVVEPENHLWTIRMPEAMYDTTLLRSTVITDLIEKFIDDFEPDKLYLEEIYQSKNPSGFRSLARLQGFICHTCHKHNIPYVIVEESKWINSFGTYGSDVSRPERKKDIMQKMNDLYGLEIKTDDLSDAIAIGTYAIRSERSC